MLKSFCLTISIVILSCSYAQIPASLDPNFKLETTMSDEFDGTSLNQNMWNPIGPGECCNWGGHSRFSANNVSVSGGLLLLKCTGPDAGATPPYTYSTCCSTGGVRTDSNPNDAAYEENYNYGYFEIYAILPGNYHNGLPNGQKFWPAFWTYHQEDLDGDPWPVPSALTVHDEIDILEPSGSQYADASTNFVGVWDEVVVGSPPYATVKTLEASMSSVNPLFLDFHKFAVEWNQDRIYYYFDDVPFFQRYNDPSLVMDPQQVIIDLQIDSNVDDFNPSITWPQYMKVDYFRYYTLKKYCGLDATILSNVALNKFKFGVYQNIVIGDGSTAISVTGGTTKIFRATDNIVIYGDFEVPLGAELDLIPTPCN